MKIVVGMSGGVDSSLAALLLKDMGHDLIGVTLKVWPTSCSSPREDVCCDERGILAAAEVARKIGVEHRVIDIKGEFRRRVVAYFCNEYRLGRTPNPCVVCNSLVKFPTLLKIAEETGADSIATGHYARVRNEDGRVSLLKGVDEKKDQAYFLCRLNQDILRRVVFPLGEHRKDDVARIADARGLGDIVRAESQEICFIPGDDYREFLKEALGDEISPGDIVDCHGNILGRHPGIEYFTVGQRCGPYLKSNVRRYVTAIDPLKRTITVGGIEDMARHGLSATEINWIGPEPLEPFQALVKIRYNHPGVMSTVKPSGKDSADVEFSVPQKAVTPGQAAVFYDGEKVLGGGWIIKQFKV